MFKCKIGIFEILGLCLIGFVGEGTELELTCFDPYSQYGSIRIPTRQFWAIFGSLGSNLYFSDFPKNRFVGNFSKVSVVALGEQSVPTIQKRHAHMKKEFGRTPQS